MASSIDTIDLDNSNIPEKRSLWSDKETKYFLKLLSEYHVTKHLVHRKYRNARVFQALEGPMRAAGFNRTYNQLRIKWKNMKKSFVDGKRLIASGSHPYSVCPFYDELYQLLKDHPNICQTSSSSDDNPPNYDCIDTASNASDCRDESEEHQDESAINLFSHFAESSSALAIKREHLTPEEHLCVEPSQGSTFSKSETLYSSDPDQLFLAMILPDLKKLSARKKRGVKMEIQKLLDDALTEEDL